MNHNVHNLIIVPGHATFKADVQTAPSDPIQEDAWVLQSFQRGEVPFYVEHIDTGLELLRGDPEAVVMFSGGRTREEAGHWSEAATYKAVAERRMEQDGYNDEERARLRGRMLLESYARDSFENVQFSLLKFYRELGRLPVQTTIIGWGFKEKRFRFHWETLALQATEAMTYVGRNDPRNLNDATRAERQVLDEFRRDPRGEYGTLAQKKEQRNPFNVRSPYALESLEHEIHANSEELLAV